MQVLVQWDFWGKLQKLRSIRCIARYPASHNVLAFFRSRYCVACTPPLFGCRLWRLWFSAVSVDHPILTFLLCYRFCQEVVNLSAPLCTPWCQYT